MTDDLPQRKIARVRVESWTPGIVVSWTPNAVGFAVNQNRQGDFSQSAQLAETMLSDDEISSSLNRAIDEILSAPFSLVPETEDGEVISVSQTVAEAIGVQWGKAVPEETLASLLKWYLLCGVAVAVLDWDKRWRPCLRVLHPQFLRYSPDETDSRGKLGRWMFSTRDGEVEVTPGNGQWVMIGSRDSWSSCAVCCLAENWIIKRLTWRDQQRYNERHGLPILLAKVPALADGDDQSAFIRDVARIGSDTTIGIPTHLNAEGATYDLELLEATDGSWKSFQETLERCDRKIQIFFLGSNAGSELTGAVGSRAASETSSQTSRVIAASRARRFGSYLRDQVIRPWALWTVPGASIDSLPWPTWQLMAEVDQTKAATWTAVAKAMIEWQGAGFEVENAVELAAELGLQIVEKEIPPALAPGALPPKPGGPPVPPGEEEREEPPVEPIEPEAEQLDALPRNEVDLGQILGQYRRIAIVGPPRTGKTTLVRGITDRAVISTDDYKSLPWRDVPARLVSKSKLHTTYIMEGVRAAHALRHGLEVDAVIEMRRPKKVQTKKQRDMAAGIETVMRDWVRKSKVPVFVEHGTRDGLKFRRT